MTTCSHWLNLLIHNLLFHLLIHWLQKFLCLWFWFHFLIIIKNSIEKCHLRIASEWKLNKRKQPLREPLPVIDNIPDRIIYYKRTLKTSLYLVTPWVPEASVIIKNVFVRRFCTSEKFDFSKWYQNWRIELFQKILYQSFGWHKASSIWLHFYGLLCSFVFSNCKMRWKIHGKKYGDSWQICSRF